MTAIDIPSIVQGAYDAALEEHLWEPWAQRLFGELGGSGGLFGLIDADEKKIERLISLRSSARAIDEYVAGYHQFDPQVEIAAGLAGTGVYVNFSDTDLTQQGVADYVRWQEAIARCSFSQTVVTTLPHSPLRVAISVHRSHELGPVTKEQHRALRRLAPQLERALQLAFQHGEKLQSAFWDGLIVGRSDQIAFLLDERGRVIRHTDAAAALVARHDGLDIARCELTAFAPTEADGLHAIIGRAIAPLAPVSGAMRVSRPSGKQPLIVICYPLQRTSRMMAPLEAAALVIVIDPSARPASPKHLLRQAFGLSTRETELATLLAGGHSVESAAAVLQVSMATARTHLRCLYEKTGTSGLAFLIQLIERIG